MRCMIHDMVKCRDCGHSISPSAHRCPQCGGVTKAARDAAKADCDGWNLLGLLFYGFIAIALSIGFIVDYFWPQK